MALRRTSQGRPESWLVSFNFALLLYPSKSLSHLVMLTSKSDTGRKNGILPTEKDFELAARKLQPTLLQIE